MLSPAAQQFDRLTAAIERRRRCKSLSPGEADICFRQLATLAQEMTDEEIEDRMTDELRGRL